MLILHVSSPERTAPRSKWAARLTTCTFCSLSRSHSMSEVIRKAKANSSGWAKSLGGMLSKFSWQSGYGAFSIHPSQVAQIKNYIRNQHEHHRIRSFQEEYLDFLRISGALRREIYLELRQGL